MRAGKIIKRTAITAAVVGAAFVGGVAYPSLHAAHDMGALRTAVGLLPSQVGAALFTAARGQDNSPSPSDVYADVLTTLKNNYYGLKDYGGQYGGTGITLGAAKGDQLSVTKLDPNSPARLAGVQVGDVIETLDGKPAASLPEIDLNTMLWGAPGTTVNLMVTHGGAGSPVPVSIKRALLPKEIDTTQMTYNGIRGMMGSLKDRYTRFMDPAAYKAMMEDNQGEFVGIGAVLGTNKANQVYVVKVLPKGPAMKAKVMAGDIILRVDGHSALKKPDTDVVKLIRGEPNTKVTLTVLRKTSTETIVIPRGVVKQEIVQHAMIDPVRKIGYISLLQFNEESDTQVTAALHDLQAQGMRGLIFDLRGNPGGLLDQAQMVASRFIERGPIVWIKSRSETLQTMENLPVDPSLHQGLKQFPLVVLVDGGSASASEIVSGAIKDTHSGILVGEKTFGKGLVQTIMPLADKSAVAITTQHYFTAHKNDINHKGVLPDIVVKFTDDQTRKHYAFQRDHPDAFYDLKNDPQLQRGVQELEQGKQFASAVPRSWPN